MEKNVKKAFKRSLPVRPCWAGLNKGRLLSCANKKINFFCFIIVSPCLFPYSPTLASSFASASLSVSANLLRIASADSIATAAASKRLTNVSWNATVNLVCWCLEVFRKFDPILIDLLPPGAETSFELMPTLIPKQILHMIINRKAKRRERWERTRNVGFRSFRS